MKKRYDQTDREAASRLRPPFGTGRYRYVKLRWRMLFGLIDAIGWALVRIAGHVRGERADSPEKARPVRSILIVQLDHFGDAVITTAVLPALRRAYPSARIDVLAAPWNAEVFTASPDVDCVHVSRRNRFARPATLAWLTAVVWWGWKMRRLNYDLAIDIRGEFPLAVLLWMTAARRRVGWECGGGGFLLTDRIRHQVGRAEVESRWALMNVIGIKRPTIESGDDNGADDSPRAIGPRFEPGPTARRAIEHRLQELPAAGGPLVVLHVGAGTAAKRWPSAHWRELFAQLQLEHDARLVLVGTSADRAIADEITEHRKWPGLTDWTGQLDVAGLAALVEQADLFIGADSGPAHLAAAVGTPVVVLFSGTNDPRQWRPWGRKVWVVRHAVACSPCRRTDCPWADHPCMDLLKPVHVLKFVTVALDVDDPSQPPEPCETTTRCEPTNLSDDPPESLSRDNDMITTITPLVPAADGTPAP